MTGRLESRPGETRDHPGQAGDPGRGKTGEGQDAEQRALAALDAGEKKKVIEILTAAYGQELYRYCSNMLGDDDLAQDVLQVVFVQSYQALGRFARRSSLRTWLYGIARHRCLDAIRKRKLDESRFEARAELSGTAADPGTPEQDLVDMQNRRILERCLYELKPAVRVAVLLRFQECFSYEEMSRICGESPATLQARVARAMPVLKRCLKARGGSL